MNRLRRFLPSTSLLVLFPAVAQAHPGHEGHELTWDYQHLAAHPLATLECFAVLALGAGVACLIARQCRLMTRRLTTPSARSRQSNGGTR
jgi:hypothetical protein